MKLSVFAPEQIHTHTHKAKPIHPRYAGYKKSSHLAENLDRRRHLLIADFLVLLFLCGSLEPTNAPYYTQACKDTTSYMPSCMKSFTHNHSKASSSSSSTGLSTRHCHSHEHPPFLSILCSTTGSFQTTVAGSDIGFNCPEPSFTRSA